MGKIAEYAAYLFAVFVVHHVLFSVAPETIFSPLTLHFVLDAMFSKISATVFVVLMIMRIAVSATKGWRGSINPEQWRLFKDGEYYRVRKRRGSSLLVGGDAYQHRIVAWHARANAAEERALAYSIFGFLVLLFAKYLEFSHFAPRSDTMFVGAAGVVLMWFAAYTWATAERGQWEMAGPPPIPPPGREEVDRQKVYGTGGLATPEQVDPKTGEIRGRSADDLRFDDWK